MAAYTHVPVMLKEVLEALHVHPGGNYVDCTVGAGGHAAAILQQSLPAGRLLGIDAIATIVGALFGTSTTTSYAESAAGIEQGGRTGLTSLITGIMFLLALLFIPVVRIVPEYATAPALIMVGLFMMKEVKRIDFNNIEEAFPAFMIIVMIALSYSISTGLALFISIHDVLLVEL